MISWVIAAMAMIAVPGWSASALDRDSTASIPNDSAVNRDSVSAGVRVYEYIAHPVLQVVTWPVETILVPVVRTLIYPTQPPVRYFLNENVVDRMRSLIGFGQDDRIMLYPTLNVAPGTSSRTGITLRDRSLFGRPTERLVAYILYYVNGDFKARTYLNADHLLGTPFSSKVSVGVVHMKNAGMHTPGSGASYYYADSSEHYQVDLIYPLVWGFALSGMAALHHYAFNQAPANPEKLQGDFFRGPNDSIVETYRGYDQSFLDRTWGVALGRDTRNNENITLAGSWFEAGWSYHDVDLGHSFHEWNAQYTKYFKLGRERYEITSDEEKRKGTLNVKEVLEKLEYEKIRKQIFSRKVVVVHLYAAQSFEIPGYVMPFYGLQTLGNDTPLRGYAGSRFRDYTVAAISTEYRFPVMRLMDGVMFNEYGVIGRSWDQINYLDYKNTWGFGIRVRRPDIYLCRAEIGIHGLSGVVFNLSVDAPF